jgi:hypothetical protein
MADRDTATPFEPDARREVSSPDDRADPLALFESEGGPQSEAQIPRRTTIADRDQRAVSLEDVRNRLGHVAWVEAVAIVDALCTALIQEGPGAPRVPELAGVSITSEGTLVLSRRAGDGPPGPLLARILHALTASGAIPVQPRLFITKWISRADTHSIPDFAGELAYFARPDGAILIQGVYERAVAAPAEAPTPRRGAADAPAPAARQPAARRRHRWRLAAAVRLVAAALGSVWVWARSSTSPVPVSSSRLAAIVSETIAAAGRVAAEVGARMGRGAPAAGDPAEPASRADAAAAPVRGPMPAPREVASALTTGTASTIAREPGGDTAPAGSGETLSSLAGPIEGVAAGPVLVPPGAAPARSIDAEVTQDSRIYSRADADVTPPTIRHPQLPPPLLSGVRADLNTIELIVSETGSVERVRLLSPPRRMADMMLLSGAKAWTFEPASKSGDSVRYRLLLSWTVTP